MGRAAGRDLRGRRATLSMRASTKASASRLRSRRARTSRRCAPAWPRERPPCASRQPFSASFSGETRIDAGLAGLLVLEQQVGHARHRRRRRRCGCRASAPLRPAISTLSNSVAVAAIDVPPIFSTLCVPVMPPPPVSMPDTGRIGDDIARGDEGRARLFRAERRHQPVGHGVVDEEGIGARKRRDVAVRSVHHVAVEHDDRAGLSDRRDDAVLVRQFGQAVLVGHAIFLLLQRHLVMVFRRLADAGQKQAVRPGDQHQRAVVAACFPPAAPTWTARACAACRPRRARSRNRSASRIPCPGSPACS